MNEQTITLLDKYKYNIRYLNISNKNIEGILDLSKFTKLNKLICNNNKIVELKGITNGLLYLDCSYNLITKLTTLPDYLNTFIFHNNPLIELYYPLVNKIPVLPQELKKITINRNYNHPLDNLPPNLTHLEFSEHSIFNHSLNNLSQNLTHLIFNNWCSFSQPINIFPPTLIYLKLSYNYNHPLDNLPISLKHLEFGINSKFTYPLDNLPPNLTHLMINNYIQHYTINMIFPIEIYNMLIHKKYLIQ